MIGLVQTKLKVLSSDTLASLCLDIGSSGCGSATNVPGAPGGGGSGGGGIGGGGGVVHDPGQHPGGGGHGITGGGSGVVTVSTNFRSMSPNEQQAMRLKCSAILRSPAVYDESLIRLCRMIPKL